MASTGGRKSILDSLEDILGGQSKEAQPNKDSPASVGRSLKSTQEDKARSSLENLEVLIGGDESKEPEARKPAPAGPPQQALEDKSAAPQAPTAEPKQLTTPELLGLMAIQEIQRRIPPQDVRRMREEVLGPAGFRVDLAEEAFEFLRTGFVGGHLFRGKMREEQKDVIREVQRRAKEVFGAKYEVVVISEPPRYDEGMVDFNPDGAPPAFLLVSQSEVAERALNKFTYIPVAILIVLTLPGTYFTAFQIGLTDLAPSQLRALLEAANEEGVVAILQKNSGTIISVSLPVGATILSSVAAHEAAHRMVAARYGVELSPPFFLPNTIVGTLGSLTRIRSLVPDKNALFDIAASGPVAGGIVALGSFLLGLTYSLSIGNDPSLVPLPDPLVQSSILLGGLVKALLGDDPRAHPLLLGGWLALVTTALNLMPVGTSDGGRVMQTLVPRGRKQAASFLMLLFMGLGVVAPGLGFTWGLITVFLQSGSERNIRDQFTPVDGLRRTAGIVLIVLSTLLLLPLPRE